MMLENCGKSVCICKDVHLSDHISLGNHSGIGENAFLQGVVRIGNNVMIARDVKIYTINRRTSATDIPVISQGTMQVCPVQIEDAVWIGSNVIILPGVTVGTGAVLGAGAVIRENVPPYAVVIGNPAQIVRYRK